MFIAIIRAIKLHAKLLLYGKSESHNICMNSIFKHLIKFNLGVGRWNNDMKKQEENPKTIRFI